jgi:hypothetical protein
VSSILVNSDKTNWGRLSGTNKKTPALQPMVDKKVGGVGFTLAAPTFPLRTMAEISNHPANLADRMPPYSFPPLAAPTSLFKNGIEKLTIILPML